MSAAARRIGRAALVLAGAEAIIHDALEELPDSPLKEMVRDAMHSVLSARAALEISAEDLGKGPRP